MSCIILYKPIDCWEALRRLRSSTGIRLLLKRVLWIGFYAAFITAWAARLNLLNFTVGKEFFTFLGSMLGLLLAFRTNTAYNRLYECRLWGQLVNTSRSLPVLLHTRLPAHDHANRA